jgi:hypothetical protein
MDEVDEVVQRWSEIPTIRPAQEALQAGDL